MRGSTAPFAHTDAWSGETPEKQGVAIRSLWLLRSPTDANPVQVFDHGAAAAPDDPTETAGIVHARNDLDGVRARDFGRHAR